MDIHAYYTSELAYLRETAQAFAREHPANAAALQGRGNDPDVERLLEGVAFLTAGLRARIDQAGMQLAHSLAELTLPHLLRSLPATTIVELTPNIRALRARQRVPKGQPLLARPLEGTACRFTTCWDVDLWPIELQGARLDRTRSDRTVIRLDLAVSDAGRGALGEEAPLRFFLYHHEPALPATLMLWLRRHLIGVTVLSTKGGGATTTLPADTAIRALSHHQHPIFPWPATAPAGYRSVLEVMALPDGHCFFEFHGLHHAEIADASALTVELTFERPPPLPAAIGPDTFRLHCTPAINLFQVPGEAIAYDPLVREAIVRADAVDPRHMEVFDVTSVIAADRSQGARRTYAPFTRVATSAGRRPPCYALRRAYSPIDGGLDTYLSLVEPPELRGKEGEVLSLQLLCTNRALARGLQVRDLGEAQTGALFTTYTNITPVSPPVRMALGIEALWRLLSHLAANQRGPADAEALRGLLSLYNFYAGADAQLGPTNERQIEAVRQVSREAVTRLIRGVPVRAIRTTIELDERGFPGQGRAHLFGAALSELFASLVNINAASEVRVVLLPSKQEYVWPVRIGT
ncbi:MAG: type VI secretion system baseplate subunit TssF [Nannocystis sp.]|nr:type VI secretion system baseplate subunit TssF [Nannocystis sp.]